MQAPQQDRQAEGQKNVALKLEAVAQENLHQDEQTGEDEVEMLLDCERPVDHRARGLALSALENRPVVGEMAELREQWSCPQRYRECSDDTKQEP